MRHAPSTAQAEAPSRRKAGNGYRVLGISGGPQPGGKRTAIQSRTCPRHWSAPCRSDAKGSPDASIQEHRSPHGSAPAPAARRTALKDDAPPAHAEQVRVRCNTAVPHTVSSLGRKVLGDGGRTKPQAPAHVTSASNRTPARCKHHQGTVQIWGFKALGFQMGILTGSSVRGTLHRGVELPAVTASLNMQHGGPPAANVLFRKSCEASC